MANPIETPLTKRLNLRYPFVVAPMFLISNKEMIVEAAEAGVLAAMPSLNARTPEAFEEDLKYIKDHTDKGFGINMTIRLTDPERLKKDVELCVKYEVPVLITSYGDPSEIVKVARDQNTFVMHDVINLKHAKKAESAGVDAIIGVCAGAGGHGGTISPYAFIPYLKDNLSIPVVAAGCISTGKQVAASLALGAELCYLGTRFIVSEECGAPDAYKDLVVSAGPEEIVYTDKVSGTHANFLKASLPDVGERTKDSKRWKDIWSAGHGVASIDDRQPLKEIVEQLAEEYEATMKSMPGG